MPYLMGLKAVELEGMIDCGYIDVFFIIIMFSDKDYSCFCILVAKWFY